MPTSKPTYMSKTITVTPLRLNTVVNGAVKTITVLTVAENQQSGLAPIALALAAVPAKSKRQSAARTK